MVTINNQWNESVSIGVNFSFSINCTHTNNVIFNSTNAQDSAEYISDIQNQVQSYEYSFKTNPDYSTKDLNLNTATYNVISFDSELGIGIVEISFNVENAEITLNQYYGFDANMSAEDIQSSIETQVQQYETNYKIGYKLTDI